VISASAPCLVWQTVGCILMHHTLRAAGKMESRLVGSPRGTAGSSCMPRDSPVDEIGVGRAG